MNFDPMMYKHPVDSQLDYNKMRIEMLEKENDYLRSVLSSSNFTSVEFKSKTWHALIDCITLILKRYHANELLTHPNEQIRVLTKCFLSKDD